MAYANLRSLLKLAMYDGDAEAQQKLKKFIEKGIDRIRERESTLFAKFKKGGMLRSTKVTWQEQYGPQLRLKATLTNTTLLFDSTSYLMNKIMSADNLKQCVRIGTVLRRESDGVQAKISAEDFDNLSCTVGAHGNNTLSNDSEAVYWKVIGESIADYDSNWQPKAVDRVPRWCSLQIFKEDFEIPWLQMRMAMENVPDEKVHQLAEIMYMIKVKMGTSLLLMEPPYSGGAYVAADATTTPACTGLLTWAKIAYAENPNANVYVNKSNVAPNPDDLNNIVYYMEDEENADFDRGKWNIAMPGVQHMYISDAFSDSREFTMKESEIGYSVTAFHSKIGKTFPILRDPHMPKDSIAVVDCSDVEWGYVSGEQVRPILIAQTNNQRVFQQFITGAIWGTKVRKPRQSLGLIYGCPSTYSA